MVKKEDIYKLYDVISKDPIEDEKFGQKVIAKNEVLFIDLNGGSIPAPWGEGRQEMSASCVLQYSMATEEVYLNEKVPFEQTYNVINDPEPNDSFKSTP